MKSLLQPGAVLNVNDFDRLGKFIMDQFGIKMPPSKRIFLQCRLQKRLRDLDMHSFQDYNTYLFSGTGMEKELPLLVDAVSTHTTDFFRESHHFDYLLTGGLQMYSEMAERSGYRIWSAGCATGEEPYSIAMTLRQYGLLRRTDFQLLATDISESVLLHAQIGIYSKARIHSIPEVYQRKYLLRGTGEYENKVRFIKEIRDHISFRQVNLMNRSYHELGDFDIIFCRNVLIYFEREVQGMILRQLCNRLLPGGILFLGHSESVAGMNLPLMQIRPTVFRKISD